MSINKSLLQKVCDGSYAYISNAIKTLPKPMQRLCNEVLLQDGFTVCPGSHDKHHAYAGGLLVHTSEVLEYSLNSARVFPEADWECLAVASIYHDAFKIRDYSIDSDGVITKQPYRDLIRHVSGSHAFFIQNEALLFANGLGRLTQEQTDKIAHCILSHHGRKEWGSPVEPQTLEAYILHTADMFSYQFGRNKNFPK
jgi:3'-5' exoribonuclease